ncbi:hypothetical protein PUNSTDRAFT_90533 [Punctularia strigosozonata HHB-11173 SS5]|uniref:uncharacterized protein n=1 Tax=Punctularia strigosozonata (strain HHB-11173) TaxID=741275 RepID=UPI0004417D6A|nr:uncharacterized protein PUNSTDRAFT_90533 [Punctularia strigosozonata HHB-11173 SS5]EIN06801.1 hypothetical protein PUNSTDRAFT_90533 [Punctularia strigosozonata HHB-11173 SS5]
MDDVRERVAQDIALRAIRKAEVVDGTKVGVVLTLSKSGDEAFLRGVAGAVKRVLLLQEHLFAIATTPSPGTRAGSDLSSLVICGSSQDRVQRAVMLACSKFLSRVEEVHNEGTKWVGLVHDIGSTSYDEAALRDVVRKAAQNLVDPRKPPPGSKGIDRILSDARARLQRLSPRQAYKELQDTSGAIPVILVDIRPESQRVNDGGIHGSLIIERNVLEWRFDPRCDARLSIADRYDLRVIVFCQEGYTSSLAAASLQDLGLLNATDVIGGFKAWKEAGLPTELMFDD